MEFGDFLIFSKKYETFLGIGSAGLRAQTRARRAFEAAKNSLPSAPPA
jgi:hypothetical protein